MVLHLGDALPVACEPVTDLVPGLLGVPEGVLVEVPGTAETARGKLLLASRKDAYVSLFAGQGITVCQDEVPAFAQANTLLRLSLKKPFVPPPPPQNWFVQFVDNTGGPVPAGGHGVNGAWSIGYEPFFAAGGTVTVTWNGFDLDGNPFSGSYSETLAGNEPGGTGDGKPGVPNSIVLFGPGGTITVSVTPGIIGGNGSSVSVSVG